MKRSAVISLFGLAALVFGIAGCESGGAHTCPPGCTNECCKPGGKCEPGCTKACCKDKAGKTLYERLGGEPAITLVVSDFVDRTAANPKVNVTRKGVGREWQATPENVAKLKKLVTEFVCSAAGGPQKYTGRDMPSSHQGMNIKESEFAAAGDDLIASLKKYNVPKKEQDELMAIVGTTKKDIVGK